HAPVSHAPVSHAPVSHAPVSQAPASHTPASHTPVGHAPASHTPMSQAVSHAPAGYPPPPRPFARVSAERDDAWRVEVRERCAAELATKPDPIRTARLRYELARASRDDEDAIGELRLALESHSEH